MKESGVGPEEVRALVARLARKRMDAVLAPWDGVEHTAVAHARWWLLAVAEEAGLSLIGCLEALAEEVA